MRFPSLNHIWQETTKVILRYPIEIATAIAGAGVAVQLTYRNTEQVEHLLTRILMTLAIALPAFLAVNLWGRYRHLGKGKVTLMYTLVLAVLALFFFTMNETVQPKDGIRFALLNLTAHLMVASAGFIGAGTTQAFWQFNKHLFLRIITAGIFSGVLFAGLAGALAAMDALFSMRVHGDIYGKMAIWIFGVFNTVFFLAGIPAAYEDLEQDETYPKVLKVFTQFVLVPLVFIYLLILLAYEAKIIVQWELPNGWVSNLIIAYGIAGILSILLVYPIRHKEGNMWIRFFARWFYLLLLPLVVLMFIAIGVRIGDYGLTEPRIFVLALAIWLAAISLFFLIRRDGNIRLIPVSLAVLSLLLCAGPMSVFEVSKRSQRNRLEKLLLENRLLQNGKVVKAASNDQIYFKQRKSISTTVEYLLEFHGPESLKPWFSTDSLTDIAGNWQKAEIALRQLNLEHVSGWEVDSVLAARDRYGYYDLRAKEVSSDIRGYDTYLPLPDHSIIIDEKAGDNELYIHRVTSGMFAIYRGKEKLTSYIDPRQHMRVLAKRYGNNSDVIPNEMRLLITGKDCDVLVIFNYLSGSIDAYSIHYDGAVFIKWR